MLGKYVLKKSLLGCMAVAFCGWKWFHLCVNQLSAIYLYRVYNFDWICKNHPWGLILYSRNTNSECWSHCSSQMNKCGDTRFTAQVDQSYSYYFVTNWAFCLFLDSFFSTLAISRVQSIKGMGGWVGMSWKLKAGCIIHQATESGAVSSVGHRNSHNQYAIPR